jgi:uncharacterized Zn finger protein
MYYRFIGKYALYDSNIIKEKKEYAERLGNSVDVKQVYGLSSGKCPNCGHIHENVPVIKQKTLVCFCENCCEAIEPQNMQSIVSVLQIHVNKSDYVDYEEIDVNEKEKIDDFVLDDEIEDE